MNEVTRLLEVANHDDKQAGAELLALVDEEFRTLAAATRLARENPDQTLDATALVHEAYRRLIGNQQFDGRSHFFAAAVEAIRRILVEQARRKQAARHGGQCQREDLDPERLVARHPTTNSSPCTRRSTSEMR